MTTPHTHQQPDDTAAIRGTLAIEINSEPSEREALEAEHGQVWSPDELRRDFEVLQFAAPLVVVRRLSDEKLGTLFFQHAPRLYWGFKEDQRPG